MRLVAALNPTNPTPTDKPRLQRVVAVIATMVMLVTACGNRSDETVNEGEPDTGDETVTSAAPDTEPPPTTQALPENRTTLRFTTGDEVDFKVSFGPIQSAGSLPAHAQCAIQTDRGRAVAAYFTVKLRSTLPIEGLFVQVGHGNAALAPQSERAALVQVTNGSCRRSGTWSYNRLSPGDTDRKETYFVLDNAVTPAEPDGAARMFAVSLMDISALMTGQTTGKGIWTGPNSAKMPSSRQCDQLAVVIGGEYQC